MNLKTKNDAKFALANEDDAFAVSVFKQQEAEFDTVSPPLLRRYCKAILRIEGFDNAYLALHSLSSNMTTSRKENLTELLVLDAAANALEEGDYTTLEKVLSLIDHWQKPERKKTAALWLQIVRWQMIESRTEIAEKDRSALVQRFLSYFARFKSTKSLEYKKISASQKSRHSNSSLLRSWDVPVLHVASIGRSGETLMLRALSVHPELKIVHNLLENDQPYEKELFRFLSGNPNQSIRSDHPLLEQYELEKHQRLVLKQGVWRHRSPFKGFVLVRNPLAIFASLLSYDKTNDKASIGDWSKNETRLIRWTRREDPKKVASIMGQAPIKQFAIYYNLRMGYILKAGLPIVRYEDFVNDPEATLKMVCRYLAVEFDLSLLNAHNNFPSGVTGHGGMDLSRAINKDSLDKFLQVLKQSDKERLVELTSVTAGNCGYDLSHSIN